MGYLSINNLYKSQDILLFKECYALEKIHGSSAHIKWGINNGCGEGKKMEGVVLRPLIELTKNNGERIIVKHKRDEFKERATSQKVVSPEELKILSDAKEIADEWVTDMRLSHVLDKLGNPIDLSEVGKVVKAMVEDVEREALGEIVFNKTVSKAIGSKTVQLFKERFCKLS